MKRLVKFYFVLIIIQQPAFSQSPFPAHVDSLILRGIDFTFNCCYDSASSVFKKVTDRYPDHIVGYFYQAATLQSKMMDFETNFWEEDFYTLIDTALGYGDRHLKTDETDPWVFFYIGTCYSYKGLYQVKNGNFLSGFSSARKGQKYLKKVLEIDSTLYDAYLGLGGYKYWSSRFKRYLWWLPWVTDDREEGIQMATLAVERGTFSYWVGVNNLGWIEYDRKNYWGALNLFRRGLRRYPESRFFLWGVADSYYKLGMYRKAMNIYQVLLTSIKKESIDNGYNEAQCRLKLAFSHFALKDYQEALDQFDAILDRKVSRKIEKRLGHHYRLSQDYRRRCLEKMKGE